MCHAANRPMRVFLLLAVLSLPVLCLTQEPQTSTRPPVKQIAEGVLDLGGVRVDKNARTVSFPVAVNMNDGNIEYLLVGKDENMKTCSTRRSSPTTSTWPCF